MDTKYYSQVIKELSRDAEINHALKVAKKLTFKGNNHDIIKNIHLKYSTSSQELTIEVSNSHSLLKEIITLDFPNDFDFSYTPGNAKKKNTYTTDAYPNFNKVIPSSFNSEVFFDINPSVLFYQLKGMLQAINSQLFFKNTKERRLVLNLRLEDGQLWLTPKSHLVTPENHHLLNFSAAVPAEYEHRFKYYEYNLDPNELLNALEAFKDYEKIEFYAMDNILRPIKLVKYIGTNPIVTSVIAPIRINNQ